jgi:YbbR domain-containing protein
MPFQDIEEDREVEVPNPPGAFERLVRRIFLEDLGLKILALGITLFIWLAVTSENQPVTIHTSVQLNFVRPQNLEISNDPPRTVEIFLTGSRNKLNNLRLLDLVATVNLSDSVPGERVIRLSERVSLQLPPGVTIDSFKPASIPIRLEPTIQRQLPIEVRLEGKPAEGFEVYGTETSLNVINLAGPQSHLNELKQAPTETISVEGKRESFTVSKVSIVIPDQKIEVLDSGLDVTVTIGVKRTEKVLENVPVRSTSEISVTPTSAQVRSSTKDKE